MISTNISKFISYCSIAITCFHQCKIVCRDTGSSKGEGEGGGRKSYAGSREKWRESTLQTNLQNWVRKTLMVLQFKFRKISHYRPRGKSNRIHFLNPS